MLGPLKKELWTSAPRCGANGSHMTQMLSTNSWGHPLVLEKGQQYEYAERRSQFLGFDEEVIGQLICSPGHDFAQSVVGRRVQIIHTSITTLTQIWMTLLLSNILPSDHNSDLSLPKCQLVYNIMTQISVYVV